MARYAIEEYPSSGHNLDIFSVNLTGLNFMVEIIGHHQTNFYRDLKIILTSDANKVLVVNEKILCKKDMVREFEKMRANEIKKGFLVLIDEIFIIYYYKENLISTL